MPEQKTIDNPSKYGTIRLINISHVYYNRKNRFGQGILSILFTEDSSHFYAAK
jgi:hypothetical protein